MRAATDRGLLRDLALLDIFRYGAAFVMITADGVERLPHDAVHLITEKLRDAGVVVPSAPNVPARAEVEPIFWRPVDDPPDVDITVMVHTPQADEPVHLGVWTGEAWESADGLTRWSPGEVVAWADVPAGRVPR